MPNVRAIGIGQGLASPAGRMAASAHSPGPESMATNSSLLPCRGFEAKLLRAEARLQDAHFAYMMKLCE